MSNCVITGFLWASGRFVNDGMVVLEAWETVEEGLGVGSGARRAVVDATVGWTEGSISNVVGLAAIGGGDGNRA